MSSYLSVQEESRRTKLGSLDEADRSNEQTGYRLLDRFSEESVVARCRRDDLLVVIAARGDVVVVDTELL